METFWGFFGLWCLVPLLLFAAMALACVFMAGRRQGGCPPGAMCGGSQPGQPPHAPGA